MTSIVEPSKLLKVKDQWTLLVTVYSRRSNNQGNKQINEPLKSLEMEKKSLLMPLSVDYDQLHTSIIVDIDG